MSHIPSTAMKHAQATDDQATDDQSPAAAQGAGAEAGKPTDAQLVREDPTLGDKAADAAERAKDAIKANPKTAIGIGAAVVAGIVAAVAAPAVIAKVNEAPKKKPAAKKTGKSK